MYFTYKPKNMKNTNQQTLGNNFASKKIKRIQIPLFTQENKAIQEGLKYFFPENPEIDKKNIVGIEAHITPELRGSNPIEGDIVDIRFNQVRALLAGNLYLCLYDENNEEKFLNLPVRSLFPIDPLSASAVKLIKRIKPITTRLKTRSCYCYCPANISIPAYQEVYLSLTIYYS